MIHIKANKIASNFKNITQRAVERYIKQLKYEGKIEFKGASKIVGMLLRVEMKNRQKSRTMKQHLSKLQNDKFLKRVGGRKDGYWEVLDVE